jgi:hypothetical protein
MFTASELRPAPIAKANDQRKDIKNIQYQHQTNKQNGQVRFGQK